VNDLLEPVLRDTFEKRAQQLDPDVRRRLMAVDYRPRARRIAILPVLGAAGLAGVAVAMALIFTLGSSPPPASAFAGWSPTPTPARPGQAAVAIARCRLGRPVLIDTRGPFTAAVYAKPKAQSAGSTVTSVPPQSSLKPAVGSCFYGPNFSSAATSGSALARVHSGQIQVAAQTVSGGSENATVLDGRVGAGVTGVGIRLSDSRTVTATVSHGWYLAWWPGTPHATAAEITTRGRTQAFALPAVAQGGAGSCSGGCASIGPVMTVGR
jgi:hypothetical protein